jgi:hypothetical protein
MALKLPPLADDKCLVTWHSLSTDGGDHALTGHYAFEVRHQESREIRMTIRFLALAIAVCALCAPALAQHAATPYAGQQNRTIKALSDDDIAALRNGEGMGMAKSAELNGYPGPKHVLTLADQLKLSADQRERVQAIFDRMSAAAKPLGVELIERERTLDQQFANGQIMQDHLVAETVAIGELEGRLRSVHLSAHLETRALLSPDQIVLYQQLRGYGDPAMERRHHPG